MNIQGSGDRPASTTPGWYPDPHSGGTQYWDGERWTGDARPPRRSFAAAAAHRSEGVSVLVLGWIFAFISVMAVSEGSGGGYLLVAFLAIVIGSAVGAYLLRGQGPTTEEVESRIAEQRKEAKKKRRTANVAGVAATVGRIFAPPPAPAANTAGAAQVNAISNPETATALQNLQKLLYSRALTDAEYTAAKEKLLGKAEPDAFEQIETLAELHRQGILGDVEFSAAKARVLRL